MAKYNFTIESDSLEEDLSKLVEIFVSAYEKCSKIDSNVVCNVRKDVKGLDNRIDGIEALMKQGFKEVNEPSIYHSSKEYEEDKKKK